MASSTESTVAFASEETMRLANAALNSNLFWFFYVVFSSFHHVNPCDILNYPINFEKMTEDVKKELLKRQRYLMKDLCDKSQIRTRIHKGGKTSKIQTFFPSKSKQYVDDIDEKLVVHYGFAAEELDYIINYDFKYRISTQGGKK